MGKLKSLFGGDKKSAPTPTVDPEAERRKAEAEAAAKANEQLLADARRRRAQKGLTATGDSTGGGVLSSGTGSGGSVLRSGGE